MNLNRLRYRGIPLEITSECLLANRNDKIANFWQFIISEPASDESLFVYFNKAVTYLRLADELEFDPFDEAGIKFWINHQRDRVMKGLITESTASAEFGVYRRLISWFGLDDNQLFPFHNPFSERARGQKDIRTLPYTKKEERQLIRALYHLYQQLKQHYQTSPELGYAPVQYKNNNYFVPNPSTLWSETPFVYQRFLSVCAYYRVAAYTGYNTSTLIGLSFSQVQRIETANGHIYRLTPIKGRKGKTVDSKDISTPKHIAFMDEWLDIAHRLNEANAEFVFPVRDLKSGSVRQLYTNEITERLHTVLDRIYKPLDEMGKPLRISASRFRKNRNLLAHNMAGPIMAAHDSNHSVSIEDRFYGSIHPHDGMKQTAAAVDVLVALSQSTENSLDINLAKTKVAENWGVEMLPLDDALNTYGKLEPMPNGLRCKNGYEGKNPDKYQRQNQNSSDETMKSLPCALYQSCLSCPQSILIDSMEDAYLLISFREYIGNCGPMHLDGYHLEQNFGQLLGQIDTAINLLSRDHVQSAKQCILEKGIHPFWSKFIGVR